MVRFIMPVLALMLTPTAHAAKRKKVETYPPSRLTTLRTGLLSTLTVAKGAEAYNRLISTRVTNVGGIEAREVAVFVESSKGLSIPLRGPKVLPPGASGVYVTSFRLPAGMLLKSHATAVCSTCRR